MNWFRSFRHNLISQSNHITCMKVKAIQTKSFLKKHPLTVSARHDN